MDDIQSVHAHTVVYVNVSHVYFFVYLQYMSEKIGGAEATKLDDEFLEMEKVCYL